MPAHPNRCAIPWDPAPSRIPHRRLYTVSVRRAPGFVSASLHRSIDGTKLTMFDPVAALKVSAVELAQAELSFPVPCSSKVRTCAWDNVFSRKTSSRDRAEVFSGHWFLRPPVRPFRSTRLAFLFLQPHTGRMRQPCVVCTRTRVAGQLVEYAKTLGDLVACKPRCDVAEDFGNNCVVHPGREFDKAEYALTEHGIRYAHHCRFFDRGMTGDQRLFHFDRRDVGAVANDDVLLARYEPEFIALAAPHQIASMVPASLQACRCRLRIVPVPVEEVCAADQQFADFASINLICAPFTIRTIGPGRRPNVRDPTTSVAPQTL
jgi:hypothetical protein